jgi:protein-S-isoprenylcysteine O-methyltransferase Ste14
MPQDTPQTSPPADHANVVVPPPVLWIVLVAAGYGVDRWLLPLPFLPAEFPAMWVGVAIWLAGFALAAVAIAQFHRAGTDVRTETPTAKIVDTGVFARSRNPIYVGAHIGTVGAAIALNSLWILATLVPFYLVIRYGVVAREEAYLERKFGPAYLDYKARVRRWI